MYNVKVLTLLLSMVFVTSTEPVPPAEPVAPSEPATVADDGHGVAHSDSDPRWQGLVRVGGLTDSGPLPDVGLAGETVVGVNGPWVSFQVFGRAWLPRKARFPDTEESGVSAWAWAAGPRACFRHVVGPHIELPLCLGASFGQIHARPFGVDDRPRSHHFWAEANLTTGVTLTPLSWLAIAGAFESGFLLKADTLMLGDQAIHEPTHTALRAFITLEFRFPRNRAKDDARNAARREAREAREARKNRKNRSK